MNTVANPEVQPKPDPAAPHDSKPSLVLRLVMDGCAVFGLFELLRIGTHVLLRLMH